MTTPENAIAARRKLTGEVIAAFEAQFRDPAFIAYVRSSETIELDSAGLRAAERGRWVGSWKGVPEQSGTYLAVWKKVTGQWVIESELYVTLDRGD